jgi:hypothetical protein
VVVDVPRVCLNSLDSLWARLRQGGVSTGLGRDLVAIILGVGSCLGLVRNERVTVTSAPSSLVCEVFGGDTDAGDGLVLAFWLSHCITSFNLKLSRRRHF